MCKSEKRTHGTTARSVPVAEMIASEARRDSRQVPSVPVSSAAETLLYAFSQAIDRESLAGLGNSLKLSILGSLSSLLYVLYMCLNAPPLYVLRF